MSENAIRKIAGSVRLMLARVVVGLVDDATKLQAMQVTSFGDLVRDKAEHFQHYGFTSVPFPGAEGIGLSLGGSTSHMAVINVDDRRYRMIGLEDGEVAIYDDQGQCVHLTRDGIVIKGAGLPMVFEDTPSVTFKAGSFVRFETPRVECTQLLVSMQYTMGGVTGGAGALAANFSSASLGYNNCTTMFTGGTIKHNGKDIGGTHTHLEHGAGNNTDTPNP